MHTITIPTEHLLPFGRMLREQRDGAEEVLRTYAGLDREPDEAREVDDALVDVSMVDAIRAQLDDGNTRA